jgi:hypothetical protein
MVIVTAISLQDGNLVVALGLGLEREPSITINPMEAVTLETDSAPRMVLYAIKGPIRDLPKGDITAKKRFKDDAVILNTSAQVGGYLFFPEDRDATHITVVVTVGSETFRFPFTRDPNFRAKFVDPEKLASQLAVQQVATASEGRIDQSAGFVPVQPVPTQPPDASVNSQLHRSSTDTSTPVSTGKLSVTNLTDGQTTRAMIGEPSTCRKNISFAVAEGGQVVSRAPKFTQKWIEKNAKKYSSICFSQVPNAQAVNYVLVFSTSQVAFNGIYPTVHTSTSSSTTPVNGSGTVTDNYGGMWIYTYNGTATTNTTTTSQVDLPYTDMTRSLYVNSYDQRGTLVSQRWRSITTRQGGDEYNTLGYNLGATLGAIHIKERLLKDAVDDVAR